MAVQVEVIMTLLSGVLSGHGDQTFRTAPQRRPTSNFAGGTFSSSTSTISLPLASALGGVDERELLPDPTYLTVFYVCIFYPDEQPITLSSSTVLGRDPSADPTSAILNPLSSFHPLSRN